jgi:hypothetical protein
MALKSTFKGRAGYVADARVGTGQVAAADAC